MQDSRQKAAIASLWDDAKAAAMSEPELLLYRSNLLGSDLRITNFGGGNTSAKVMMEDPLTGGQVEVLWVKGSGGDLGSIKIDGFSTLYMDKLQALKQRALDGGRPLKKSEVLRAGLLALAEMGDAAFLAAISAVPAVKTGRPAKA